MSPYSPNTASGTKPRTSSNTAGSPPASAPTGTPELSVTIPQTPQTPQTPSEISVTWMDPNTYRTQPAKKQQVVETVKSSSVTAAAVNRGAVAAIIRGGVHKSRIGGDQADHVAVDYKTSSGEHCVTTKHVPYP